MHGRLMMKNLINTYPDYDIRKTYEDKYGEFDEDAENYSVRA